MMLKNFFHYGYTLVRYFFKIILPVKNVIIFESLTDFDGSSYEIFNYLKNNEEYKKYTLVWAIRNDINNYRDGNKVKFIKLNGHSIKNLLYENMAKYVFYENYCPITLKKKETKIIYLSHGVPPLKNVKGIINVGDKCDYCICTSNEMKKVVSEQFSVNEEKIFVSGLPRNDLLFEKNDELKKLNIQNFNKIFIWMPTFRKLKYSEEYIRVDSQKEYFLGLPLIESSKDLKELDCFLAKMNMFLIIKIHPGALNENDEKSDYSNIRIITTEEMKFKDINLYKLFSQTDALISDYSSVTFDYMLLDKPLAYIIDDLNEYKLGFAHDNVLEYMPGHHIKNLEELKKFMEDIYLKKDLYKKERNLVRKRVQDFSNNNTKRIVEFFISN